MVANMVEVQLLNIFQLDKGAQAESDQVNCSRTALKSEGNVKVLPQEHLYHRVQLYLKKVREEGGALSVRIAMAAGHGILQQNQIRGVWK